MLASGVLSSLMGLGALGCDEGAADAADAADAVVDAVVDAAVDAEPVGGTYPWLIIIDYSVEEAMASSPGADICGVSVVCGADAPTPAEVDYQWGDGEICDEEREGCSANRADPKAALDSGEWCEAASVPSDYLTLGMGGTLALRYGRSLRGCSIEVVELVGNQQEGYELWVCRKYMGPDWECLTDPPLASVPNGGNVQVNVP
jgi:hypothetical protein